MSPVVQHPASRIHRYLLLLRIRISYIRIRAPRYDVVCLGGRGCVWFGSLSVIPSLCHVPRRTSLTCIVHRIVCCHTPHRGRAGVRVGVLCAGALACVVCRVSVLPGSEGWLRCVHTTAHVQRTTTGYASGTSTKTPIHCRAKTANRRRLQSSPHSGTPRTAA